MALWLEAEDQELLLKSLGELVDARGPAPLLAAPIEPTEVFFPDRFTPDAAGARVVAERLLGYAGLPHHRAVVEVGGGREADVMDHPGAAAWFTGVEGFRCFFGVAERHLGDSEALVAALAHEVAHAFRRVHGLEGQGALPEEPATDATTVFLGFGVLTTNAAFRYRTDRTGITQSSLGYLPPQAMAFLLAAQALGRRAGWPERRRLAGLLETNQAAVFSEAHAALSRRGDVVLGRLRLPDGRQGTPAPRPDRHVEPPPDPPAGPAVAAPSASPGSAGRGPTFRVDRRPRRALVVPALALAAAPFLLLLRAGLVRAAVVGGLLLGGLVWRLLRDRPDRCADPECEAILPAGVQACPGCGRRLAGTIRRPEDRLEAEERLRAEDALDHEALEAGAPRADA